MYAMTDTDVNHGNGGTVYALRSMAPEEETMGQRIARLMEAKNLSVIEVARLCGVKRASVYQWINGASPNIRPENFQRLLKVLDTDAAYLLWGPTRRDPYHPPGGAGTRLNRRRD